MSSSPPTSLRGLYGPSSGGFTGTQSIHTPPLCMYQCHCLCFMCCCVVLCTYVCTYVSPDPHLLPSPPHSPSSAQSITSGSGWQSPQLLQGHQNNGSSTQVRTHAQTHAHTHTPHATSCTPSSHNVHIHLFILCSSVAVLLT